MATNVYPNYLPYNSTYKPISPIFGHVGNFTPFYIAIAICSVILGLLLILNVVCCCSKYSGYWLDRHTGNRWIVSIWSATPHKQPPLDLTELGSPHDQYIHVHPYHSEYLKESEIPSSMSSRPLASSEYLELHKRESDL